MNLRSLAFLTSFGFLGSLGLSAKETLLYTGLTRTGWQIHALNLSTGQTTQLTKSPGDKRTPLYSKSKDQILYRGPRGRILALNRQGEETVEVNLTGCGDFSLQKSDTDETTETILVTRLVTGNPQRQQIWKATPPDHLDRVARAPEGSFRQIQTQDSRLFATHIWRSGEERVVELIKQGADAAPDLVYWTSSQQIAAYPRWLGEDLGIISSLKVSSNNYDLHLISKAETASSPLVSSEEFSEFGSTYHQQEQRIYYERVDKSGVWSLASVPIRTTESRAPTSITLPHPAKEPAIVTLPANWKN